MHVGCKCNVVIATCSQRYLESTFLRCHNVVITTLSQPKDNVVTTLSQRDFVCWDVICDGHLCTRDQVNILHTTMLYVTAIFVPETR